MTVVEDRRARRKKRKSPRGKQEGERLKLPILVPQKKPLEPDEAPLGTEAMALVHATYKKVGTLGRGSFGKVYLVLHIPTKELRFGRFRIKVLKQMDVDEDQISETKDPRKEALREAWVLKKMHHPFIIAYHEVFVTPRQKMCIVMGYADGGDLHTFLKRRRGLLAEEEVLRMFTQLCLAIHHVHKQRVIHRDLKSQNVFLHGPSRTVKLGDFGISRVLEQTRDLARTMVGTPYYLSPEIIMEQPYGFKSDVWSMGIILYEMLTLKHPFDARNIQHLAVRILNLKFEDPDKTRYTKDVRDTVRVMLTRESEKRPSVEDLLNFPLLRRYVLKELETCNDLDFTLKNGSTSPNNVVKLPALPSAAKPSGFVARIRGLTSSARSSLTRPFQRRAGRALSPMPENRTRYYQKEDIKLPAVVVMPSPVTNPQDDQVLLGSIGDPVSVTAGKGNPDISQSQDKKLRSAEHVRLPPIVSAKAVDSLEKLPSPIKEKADVVEASNHVEVADLPVQEEEYPEDFEVEDDVDDSSQLGGEENEHDKGAEGKNAVEEI
ncbi:hypothetical protein FOL47_008233, partial [Perkinsus chesapeaki]